jgi:serine/threonine-protein kinase
METVLRTLDDDLAAPRAVNPRASADLEAVCLKCLARSPAQRYASAGELARDLRRYLAGEAVSARRFGVVDRLRHWAQRRPALAATLLALGLFYLNHLLLLAQEAPGEGGGFHYYVTGLLLLWALGAAVFQRLVHRPRWESVGVFGWAALDVVLLTALLWARDGMFSPLVVGYLLLIAVAALRFRTRLIWFVTELCLLSYASLVVDAYYLRTPGTEPASPQVPMVFALGLLLMGMTQTLLLRRVRAARAAD